MGQVQCVMLHVDFFEATSCEYDVNIHTVGHLLSRCGRTGVYRHLLLLVHGSL